MTATESEGKGKGNFQWGASAETDHPHWDDPQGTPGSSSRLSIRWAISYPVLSCLRVQRFAVQAIRSKRCDISSEARRTDGFSQTPACGAHVKEVAREPQVSRKHHPDPGCLRGCCIFSKSSVIEFRWGLELSKKRPSQLRSRWNIEVHQQ